jgi:type IV pilus assembly protein PilA
MTKLRQRLSHQEGFTLIELLIVIVIIGILLAIAVPSYLGFKDRANKRAVQSDLRAALPTAEAFYSDHGTYSNLTVSSMAEIDTGLASDVVTVAGTPTKTGYCLSGSKGGQDWSVKGPGASWFNNTACSGNAVSVN